MSVFNAVLTMWTVIVAVLVGWLVLRAYRLYTAAVSPLVKELAGMVVAISALLLAGSIQRVSLQAVEVGLLPEEARGFLLTVWQALIGVIGTVLVVVMVVRIRPLLDRIEGGERVVAVLTERVAVSSAVSEWGLTARELEVLELIGQGRTSDALIAEELFISPATAATHVRNILRKAGLNNRNDLMFVIRPGE